MNTKWFYNRDLYITYKIIRLCLYRSYNRQVRWTKKVLLGWFLNSFIRFSYCSGRVSLMKIVEELSWSCSWHLVDTAVSGALLCWGSNEVGAGECCSWRWLGSRVVHNLEGYHWGGMMIVNYRTLTELIERLRHNGLM